MSSSSSVSSERFTGRVKWFNNKAGYGFVTVTDGSKSGSDVFVHHSAIKVASEQYKYLVQGEYIEFSLSDTKTSDHEYQAGEVSGIKGGKLMCETRMDTQSSRTQYRSGKSDVDRSGKSDVDRSGKSDVDRSGKSDVDASSEHVKMPRSIRAKREDGEWAYVSKDKHIKHVAGISGRLTGRFTAREATV
jgi:CspA family cold shock protein